MALLKSLIPSPFTLASHVTDNGGTLVNFVDANVVDSAARFTSNAAVTYPVANFNFEKGAIRVRLKVNTDWRLMPETPNDAAYILRVPITATRYFGLNLAASPTNAFNGLRAIWYDNGIVPVLNRYYYTTPEPYWGIMGWTPNTWHDIWLYWDFTLVGAGFVLVRVDDHYRDMETDLSVVSAVEPDGSAKIYMGNHTALSLPLIGNISKLDIYDDPFSAIDGFTLPSPVPQNFFDPTDWAASMVSLESLYADGDGYCKLWQTNADNSTDCLLLGAGIEEGEALIWFKKANLKHVYPGYVPTETDIANAFTWKGTKGEIEGLLFNAYSREDLSNVVVTRSALVSSEDTIPTDNIKLKLVYNWFQGGPDAETVGYNVPTYVGELLLNDDSYQLEADPALGQFVCPEIPLSDQVDMTFAAGTSRQFCLIIDVPSDAVPGIYTGTVTLASDELDDQVLTYTFEVLPFVLQDTDKKLIASLGTNGTTWYAAPSKMDLDWLAIFTRELQEIKSLGFNVVQITATDDGDSNSWDDIGITDWWTIVQLKIDACVTAGIENIILRTTSSTDSETIAARHSETVGNYLTSKGYQKWFYGVDELGSGSYATQALYSAAVHTIGGKIFTTLAKTSFDAYDSLYPTPFDPACLDGTILVRSSTLDGTLWGYFAARQAGTEVPNPDLYLDSFYWQGRDGDARYHRYYIGFFTHLADLNSAFPQGSVADMLNWNDFNRYPTKYRAYGFFYPAVDAAGDPNPISTFQGLAIREGVRDLKYLATWQYYYNQAVVSYPSETSDSYDAIQAILAYYKDVVATRNLAGMRVSEEDWDSHRELIIAEINTLRTLTVTFPAGTPTPTVPAF